MYRTCSTISLDGVQARERWRCGYVKGQIFPHTTVYWLNMHSSLDARLEKG